MRNRECGWTSSVAISISKSPDFAIFGLSRHHLGRAMETLATYLLSYGFRLAYGGDLRSGGFTEHLFEIASRYDRSQYANGKPAVTDYLAWSAWNDLSPSDFQDLEDQLQGIAEIKRLDLEGTTITSNGFSNLPDGNPQLVASSLTAMRKTMLKETDARVVLGGRVADYQGSMPGIAEESLLTLRAKKPLYILGGFGGCARDIAESLRLVECTEATAGREWDCREEFEAFSAGSLNNGLTEEENGFLATTDYMQEAVSLVVRGLDRVNASSHN